MGTDCSVYIPSYVRAPNICAAIGVMARLPYTSYGISGTLMRSYDTINIRPETHDFGMGKLYIAPPTGHFMNLSGLSGTYVFLSTTFEGKTWTYLMARATATRMAFFRKLAKFFGGYVRSEMNENLDCYPCSHTRDKYESLDEMTSNEWWHEFHGELYAIEPLTIDDIRAERENGRYNDQLLDMDELPLGIGQLPHGEDPLGW